MKNLFNRTGRKKLEADMRAASLYARNFFEVSLDPLVTISAEGKITDVNNAYIKRGEMTFSLLEGYWTDAGTFESLLRAGLLVQKQTHQ
jgi:glucose-1-phosphate thymidylyltransferase